MKNTYLAFTLLIAFLFQGFAYAEDGKILFMSDRTGKQQIYMMKPDGSEQVRVISSMAIEIPGNCSSDGKKFVFASTRDAQSTTDIYIANIDGTQVIRLTNNQFVDTSPVWSPDGKKILFESN